MSEVKVKAEDVKVNVRAGSGTIGEYSRVIDSCKGATHSNDLLENIRQYSRLRTTGCSAGMPLEHSELRNQLPHLALDPALDKSTARKSTQR